jgi:Arc/MetJ-type ribon-helix-helix transcriptional regulator
MVILKTPHTRKEQNKFIGVYYPQWIYSYFSLYTLAKGVSKSEYMRQIVEEWTHKQQESDEQLIAEIVLKIKAQWQEERRANPTKNFDAFKKNVCVELRSRGVDSTNVETILKAIQ